jgi:hypothetical protein
MIWKDLILHLSEVIHLVELFDKKDTLMLWDQVNEPDQVHDQFHVKQPNEN